MTPKEDFGMDIKGKALFCSILLQHFIKKKLKKGTKMFLEPNFL